MKKLLSLVAVMIIATTTFAQVNEVTLTVIGTGVDEEKATLYALRSAIEQSFGTFVSANTTILNDKLVQDEIVSVSSGNVKEYKKLAVATLPNKQVSVSLTVTVAINKLISYAKSKGSRAEFAGQTFATNIKLMKLRQESSAKAIKLMIQQLEKMGDDMFNFELVLGDPQKNGNYYLFHPEIKVYSNESSTNFYKLLFNTLNALNLSDEDIAFCKKTGIPICCFWCTESQRKRSGKCICLPIDGYLYDESNWKHSIGKAGYEPVVYYQSDSYKAKHDVRDLIKGIMHRACFRFVISEIGKPNNKYACEVPYSLGHVASWANKNRRVPSEFYYYANRQHANGSESYESTNWNLYSVRNKTYTDEIMYCQNQYRESLHYLALNEDCRNLCMTETHIPIKLTKEQKKAQKKGTYTGPTYTVKYENPSLVAKFLVEIPIPASDVENGRFQGFEIK